MRALAWAICMGMALVATAEAQPSPPRRLTTDRSCPGKRIWPVAAV